ncbi:hypothetical protein GUJ93_ZPchr0005g14507 [Zizania palustris]|uniref:Uncharacterized protein n=1 Tax=Zizania palustris TaxID=103762 RepID=A0A8J5SI47_ZIZPA|nr:hypothetical protein GUJ93_ZPchr0005g14507 [Zizania palustris]
MLRARQGGRKDLLPWPPVGARGGGCCKGGHGRGHRQAPNAEGEEGEERLRMLDRLSSRMPKGRELSTDDRMERMSVYCS